MPNPLSSYYKLMHQRQGTRVPLLGQPTYRATNSAQDQRFVNVYFEKITNPLSQGSYFSVTKRPGLTPWIQPPAGAAVGRGFYTWMTNNKTYSVFGNSIYSGTTNIYNGLMATSTGICGFVETSGILATKYLAINDGVKLYLINTSDVVTTVTSGVGGGAGFPASNLGDIVFFDEYMVIGTSNGTIYNSNPEDPTTWGASNFTNSDAFPDDLVAITRQNDVLLAFGTMSTQFFYDAGNPAPGSFMSTLVQGTLQVGCASGNSIDKHENYVFWVAQAQDGGYSVQKLEGLTNLKPVSTPAIERLLNAEGSNIVNCSGFLHRVAGHFFYILNLVGANRTLVYDIEENVWSEWQSGASGVFNIVCTGHDMTYKPVVQHATNGKLYYVDPAVYQDDGASITTTMTTLPLDFDTMTRKFCSRFELVGDRYTSSNPVSVSYSDDDYATFSTPRTVDLVKSSTNSRAQIQALGSFRRRVFKLSHTANMPLRLEAIELDLQTGAF